MFFLITASAVKAKTWYVSPMTNKAGWRENGVGSDANPWDLQTALAGGKGMVLPGDTIYVHDGAPYWGYKIVEINGATVFAPQLYTSTLKGKEGAPIIVKAYPGEHPVLDGATCTTPEAFAADEKAAVKISNAALMVSGSYTWFWGLEITNSSHTRESSIVDGGGGTGGVYFHESDHIKLINLIVHDNSETGISVFRGATNAEIEGCLIYYNGYVAIKPRNKPATGGGYKTYGPGIYSQNRSDSTGYSKKTIRNNVIFEQFYNGVQVYGSDRSFIQNYDFTGNTIFNNGLISKITEDTNDLRGEYNLIMGGQTDGWDLNISNNQVCYFSKYGAKANLKIGYSESHFMHRCIIDSNIFVAGVTYPAYNILPLMINNALSSEFKYNLVYGYAEGIRLNYFESLAPGWEKDFSKNFTSDKNEFIYCSSSNIKPDFFDFRLKPKSENMQESSYNLFSGSPHNWTNNFGLDKNSGETSMNDYKKKLKNGLQIIVTPDVYEPGLAKMVVFNWDSLPEISFSLSNIIPQGNPYYFTDIQDYKKNPEEYNPDSAHFYHGNINVKMTGLKTVVPNGLAGSPAMIQPEHTDARFGVYWLQYFPYTMKLVTYHKVLECVFTNAKGNEIKNPPFLHYSWKQDNRPIENANTPQCKLHGSGNYQVTVTDDKNLKKEVHALVVNGKISSK